MVPASIFAGLAGRRAARRPDITIQRVIWCLQAVIPGIWDYSTVQHRRSCRSVVGQRSLSIQIWNARCRGAEAPDCQLKIVRNASDEVALLTFLRLIKKYSES